MIQPHVCHEIKDISKWVVEHFYLDLFAVFIFFVSVASNPIVVVVIVIISIMYN